LCDLNKELKGLFYPAVMGTLEPKEELDKENLDPILEYVT
jgi:hypothetical protein